MKTWNVQVTAHLYGDDVQGAYEKLMDEVVNGPFEEAEMGFRKGSKKKTVDIEGTVRARGRDNAVRKVTDWEMAVEDKVWVEMEGTVVG